MGLYVAFKIRLLGIFPLNKLVPGHNFSSSRNLMDPITELNLYFEVYSIQCPNFRNFKEPENQFHQTM
jgi:hypothetical protein